MALILNIDTSTGTASVCIAKDGELLQLQKNEHQKDHAAWLHIAIQKIMQDAAIDLSKIDAVAVTIGPGSYTGLRVGLASAKGICYALEKPLLTLNTLLVMANATKNEPVDYLCPMIDARRMEVFAAIYTKELEQVKEPLAMIIDQNSFSTELSSKKICFSGNGSDKLKAIINNMNAVFSNESFDVSDMVALSESLFTKKEFSDLAYTEPLYLKEFYTPAL